MKTLFMLLVLVIMAPRAAARQGDATDRVAKWQQDIDFLVEELPRRHKNAFFRCPKERWLARAAEVRGELGTLRDEWIVVDLRRLVAMLGDGHTQVWFTRETTIPAERAYPIATIWLADGVFAPVLPNERAALIGERLVRIGETPIEEAIRRVAEVRANDNEWGMKNGVMADLRDVDTLARLGIVQDEARAAFTFVDAAGKETTVTLAPVSGDISSLVTQRPDPGSSPAWRSPRRPAYGHEVLAESRTFYIWYDTCSDRPGQTVREFIDETMTALDGEVAKKNGGVERVVIDFRRNGGGNSALFMPLIEQLAHRDALKEKGKIIGLIGRRTFSSGMMNAYRLRNATHAILMGEPTGGSPNGYGEVRTFTLPNSKLTLQYSTKQFRGVKEDVDTIAPDVRVEADSAAYFAGRDVVLERAIEWKGE